MVDKLEISKEEGLEFARLASLAGRQMDTHALQVWEVGSGNNEGRGIINQRSMVARALRIAAVWGLECKIAKAASELLALKRGGFKIGEGDPSVHARMQGRLWRELEEAGERWKELSM